MRKRINQLSHVAADLVPPIDIGLLVQLFEHAFEIAFFIKDAEGRYVGINESLARRHGLKCKADAIGKRPSEICPGEFGQVPTEQDARILRTGVPLIDHLEMQWHLPHEPVWCSTTKLPIVSADGQVSGIIGFSRDVRMPFEGNESSAELAKVLKSLEDNISEIRTPSSLAERANLSLQRLARLTKRLLGLTPGQLMTKTRIAVATRLLIESPDSIADIALASGFYDQSAFTRSFKVATGVTPSEFRKQTRTQSR